MPLFSQFNVFRVHFQNQKTTILYILGTLFELNYRRITC
jgi:hypothetical protein